MQEYHKIQSIYKRDPKGKFLMGQFSRPEIEFLENLEWNFTEKVDGTNIRLGYDDEGNFRIGGRTERAQIPTFLLDALQDLDLGTRLHEAVDTKNVCLYGEGYGAKIQKGGGNYRPDNGFVLFDVRIGNFWLLREDVEDIASQLGLDIVPKVGRGTLGEGIKIVTEGLQSYWGKFEAEGIIATPTVPMFDRRGSRIITKIKAKDFR